MFTAARDYLKGVINGKTTIPTKTWKAEYAKLTAERKTLNQRYLALKEEVKKSSKSERAFTVSCVRNSGSSNPAERRIWDDNRQGGKIVNTYCHHPVLAFYLPDKS